MAKNSLTTVYDLVVEHEKFTIEAAISDFSMEDIFRTYRVKTYFGLTMIMDLNYKSEVTFACDVCCTHEGGKVAGKTEAHRLERMGKGYKCFNCGKRAPLKGVFTLNHRRYRLNEPHWTYRTRSELRTNLEFIFDHSGLNPLAAVLEVEELAMELDKLKQAAERLRLAEVMEQEELRSNLRRRRVLPS